MGRCKDYVFILLFWVLHVSFNYIESMVVNLNWIISKVRSKVIEDKSIDRNKISKLLKIPQHIAFLVMEDTISYEDIASLVVWCISANIDNISLYDIHGKLKANQGVLLRHVNQRYRRSLKNNGQINLNWRPHCNSLTDTVVVSNGGSMYPDSHGNGNVSIKRNGGAVHEGRSVTIALVSPEDGKFDIINAAKTICNKTMDGTIVISEINENTIESHLETNKSLPDPSLIVRLGRISSNADFLPWQIRLSEIHSISSHHHVRASELIDVLEQYGSCNQRFGK